MLHGLGAIHRHVQRLRRILQTVGHVGGALHLPDAGGDGLGGGLQRLHILAVHRQGHAVAGDVAHHAGHDVGRGDGAVHVGAQGLDLLAHAVAGVVVRQGDVDFRVILAAGGGHQAHAAVALDHGAHGVHALDGHAAAGHLVGVGHSVLAGAVLRHGNGNADAVHIHIRHEAEAPAQRDRAGQHQQRHRAAQHRRLVVQRPEDGLFVGGVNFIQQARLLLQRTLEHAAGHGGHQRQRHQKTGQQGIGDGQGQIGEHLAGQALHEHDGGEHAHGGQGAGGDSAQHLLGAGHGGLHHRGAPGAEPVDILNDHHGVIHQHAHRYQQAAEGDHIDGNTGEVHQHHREDHAGRDGDQGDEGGPPVTQEQEQHHHGEQRAPQQGGDDGIHDQVDIVALIHQGLEADVGVLGRQLLQTGGDVVGHLRRGVVGLLGEGSDDAVFAVELGVNFIGVVGIEHGGHVAEADGLHAVDAQIEQHHILQLAAGADLVAHGHHVADAGVIVYVPGGHGEILRRQQLLHHGDGQHTVQIQLLQHLLAGLGQLLLPLLDLLEGQLQLDVALGHQQHAVQRGLHAVGDLAAQRVEPLGVIEEVLDILDGLFHLVHTLLQLILRPLSHQRGKGLGVLRHTLGQRQILRRQGFVLRLSGGLVLIGGVGVGDDGQIGLYLLVVGGHGGLIVGDALAQRLLLLRHGGSGVQGVFQSVHRFVQRVGHAVADAVGSFGNALIQRFLGVGDLLLGAVQLAGGLVQLLARLFADGLGQGGHLLLVQHHVHLAIHGAHDLHAGHAGDARQLAGQLAVHEVAELAHVHVAAADGGHHHGDHGGVHLQNIGGGHGIVPLTLHRGHLLLDINAQRVHVGAVLELHHHHGDAVLAGGLDLLQLIQRGQRFFQRLGDVLLHAFRACAGVAGDDDDIGIVHVGHQVGGHFQIGYHTQNQDRQRHHIDGQRFFYTKGRHEFLPFCCAARRAVTL